MRTPGLWTTTGALLGLTIVPSSVSAWDSVCHRFKDPTRKVSDLGASAMVADSRGCEGIDAARGRWRDVTYDLDEHRHIFARAVELAGLPTVAVLDTQNLAVLTDFPSKPAMGKQAVYSSVDLKPPEEANGAVYRSFALDELAQLPDFSFGLWDWARGNETCPIKPAPAPFNTFQQCHTFTSHMGAVNSNHFPPQSDQWAAHYHELAMTRAGQCRSQRASIWAAGPDLESRQATDARLAMFFRACEVEALAYEAVGQHFLQDSWSAGHMWHRWGSTDLSNFKLDGLAPKDKEWNKQPEALRQLIVAEITAAAVGTIHGSDNPFFELAKGYLNEHDAMCYPHPDVRASDGGAPFRVVGDLHLHDVIGGPPSHSKVSPLNPLFLYDVAQLAEQREKLLTCATRSVGAVYAALADSSYGAPVLGAATVESPAFNAAECEAPSATNLAMYYGIETWSIFPVAGAVLASVIKLLPPGLVWKARNDYAKLRHAAWLISAVKPDGTEISRLYHDEMFTYEDLSCTKKNDCKPTHFTAPPTLYTMLGVEPNRCYSADDREGCTVPAPGGGGLASFIDPQLPDPLLAPDPEDHGGALALAFHTSRAPALCDAVTAGQLAALPGVVAGADSGQSRAIACQACAEWTAPFLRIGKGVDDYDAGTEPLCHFASKAPAEVPYVYEPAIGTADPVALARRHCGCRGLVAVTNDGLKRLDVAVSSDAVALKQIGATVPVAQVGVMPRDVAAASHGRLLVSNSKGEVVGVRDDAEVDLDGDMGNGKQRLEFAANLQGIAVVNVAAKELMLTVTSDTGELIAWDLGAHTQCERFSVAQVPGQGAYDVVVSADLKQVWISLRKSSPLAGALASVSLSALSKCDGTAEASLEWLAPPGTPAGLGPMALAPDGSRLAVGGRLEGTCLDQVLNKIGAPIEIQVSCDRVYVLDVASNTWLKFGGDLSMPTRPGRYPAGVAWFGDSTRLAFASFQGIDVGGDGDSGWPMTEPDHLPIGGTLRIADTKKPSYQGGGNNTSRYWSYNMPLDSQVIGPTVVVDGGSTYGSGWVFVGTLSGRVAAYAVSPNIPDVDPMWEDAAADPETSYHVSTSGAWYGGCQYDCAYPGSYLCPDVCPDSTVPGGFGAVELGSGVRVLAAY